MTQPFSKTLITAICTFLACSVSAVAAPATDWHVDAAVGAGGDGSPAAPFHSVHSATDVAEPGDRILLAAGTYQATRRIVVYGHDRRTLLDVPPGVEILGAGREDTILQAPDTEGPLILGITSEDTDRSAVIRDLRVSGPCFQGIQLRGASPTITRVDVVTDIFGASSLAVDVRDGSDPLCTDLLIDGGHSGLFVEFGSRGRFENCVIGRRPNEAIACSGANPTLVQCDLLGAGRDLIVLNQGSQPVFRECSFGRGDRWTVRVAAGYARGSTVDLGGNSWFSSDLEVLEEATWDAKDDPVRGATVDFLPLAGSVANSASSLSKLKASWD